MKYLALLFLLVGCSKNPSSFVGKCYIPFVYNGEVVKVQNCTNKEFFQDGSNFCLIERKHITLFNGIKTEINTIFISSLEDYSIEVDCSEY